MVYIYDATVKGLLTATFTAFEYREFMVKLITSRGQQAQLFGSRREIQSDSEKAARVYRGLTKQLTPKIAADFWRAFLCENPKVSQTIFDLIISIFRGAGDILHNFGDEKVLQFNQALQKVNRERHRMKAFIRFQKSSNSHYVAVIEPDFNVLPLIIDFFRQRYADQVWLIYDKKRRYGIYYNLQTVTEVTLDVQETKTLQKSSESIFVDPQDANYENLWCSYFESTNIEARKNLSLHIKHVPKRYWRYLPEKRKSLFVKGNNKT